LIPVNQGHTGATVAEVIREEFAHRFELPLDQYICSSVSDSASNAKKVSELLGVEPETCQMHCMDLVMNYALGLKGKSENPAPSHIIDRHSALSSHFSRSPKDLALLKDCASSLNIPFVTPRNRQDTRMASTQKMLLQNLRLKSAYITFAAKYTKLENLILNGECTFK
jgi:hypothetical protein